MTDTTKRYEYCFTCCGRSWCYDTQGKRNHARKQHKKTTKHKISQAVAHAWVEWQKKVKHLASCGMCGQPTPWRPK